MTQISIDKNKCLGCGTCQALAPDYFQLDYKEGKAKVVKQPEKIDPDLESAINSCPVGAILKEEEK